MALPRVRVRDTGESRCGIVFHLSWIILLLALAPAYAEIYKWIDRDGRVHFSDTLASVPLEYRDRIEEKASLTPTPRRDSCPTASSPRTSLPRTDTSASKLCCATAA